MICFRDMTYCADAEQCKNKEGCFRWFSPKEQAAADKWWGKEGAPIALSEFKGRCAKWESIDGNT